MKILLVLDQFDGANNGNTNSARRLKDELGRQGHEVRVAAQGEDRDDKYGFALYHLPFFDKLVTAQGFTFASRDRAKMEKAVAWADIVHVLMPFALGRSAVLEAIRQKKPVTGAFHVQPENIWYSVHLGNCRPLINFTYWGFRQYLFKYFHYIHCPSHMIENQLRRHGYKAEMRESHKQRHREGLCLSQESEGSPVRGTDSCRHVRALFRREASGCADQCGEEVKVQGQDRTLPCWSGTDEGAV